MKNFKAKVKKVWNEHGPAICGIAVASILGTAIGAHNCRVAYKDGFDDGWMCSFEPTVKWITENIPETNLEEAVKNYMKANPDKVINHATKAHKWF